MRKGKKPENGGFFLTFPKTEFLTAQTNFEWQTQHTQTALLADSNGAKEGGGGRRGEGEIFHDVHNSNAR